MPIEGMCGERTRDGLRRCHLIIEEEPRFRFFGLPPRSLLCPTPLSSLVNREDG